MDGSAARPLFYERGEITEGVLGCVTVVGRLLAAPLGHSPMNLRLSAAPFGRASTDVARLSAAPLGYAFVEVLRLSAAPLGHASIEVGKFSAPT